MARRKKLINNSGIPQHEIEYIAQCILPDIIAFYESEEGQRECKQSIAYYMENARIIAEVLESKNIRFTGGKCSPYLWLECPDGMKSWDFFDYLLDKEQVVGTPGAGFGNAGEGYFRLTSFGSREATVEAAARLKRLL